MEFLTIAEELVDDAKSLSRALKAEGFKVIIEESPVGAPYTPTMTTRRTGSTTHIYVEAAFPKSSKLLECKAFCSAQSNDTRLAIAIPEKTSLSASQIRQAQQERIGVYSISDDGYHELCPPTDLTIDLSLPDLSRFSNTVRTKLGACWATCRRGNHVEAFDDACIVLEGVARTYLIRHRKKRTLLFLDENGGSLNVSDAKIRRMTMGQLAAKFNEIHNPNHADAQLAKILQALNPDRVRVAHRRHDGRSRRALNNNMRRQFWSIAVGVEAALT